MRDKPTESDPSAVLKRLKADAAPPRALLVVGVDRVRRRRFLGAVMALCPADASADRLPGGEADPTDVTHRLASRGLFSSHSVVVVGDVADASADAQKRFADAAESAPAGSTLLLEASALPANSVLLRRMRAAGAAAEFTSLRGAELSRWVEKEFRAARLSPGGPEAVEALVAAASEDPDVLVGMIERLALYLDDDGERRVDAAVVLDLFGTDGSAHEFALADAVAARDRVAAELLVRRLLDNGKSPFALVPLLLRSFTQYAAVADGLAKGEAPPVIRTRLGIPPFLFGKAVAAVRGRDVESLRRACGRLLRADSVLKNRSLGHDAVLGELIAAIAS